MKVTTPHFKKTKVHHEHFLSWSIVLIFSVLLVGNWIFNIFDITFFIHSTMLYVILGLGTYLATRASLIIGTDNFAGKSLSSFGIMFASFTFSSLLNDYAIFFFEESAIILLMSYAFWIFGALFAILGLDHILHTLKHTYESKHSYASILLFLGVFICSLFFVGVPDFTQASLSIVIADVCMLITYTAIITTAIITLAVVKRDASLRYIYPIAIGLLSLTLSYIIAIYSGAMANIFLLAGILLLLLGVYAIQTHFETKRSDRI